MRERLPGNTCGLVTTKSDEGVYLGVKTGLSYPEKLDNFKRQAQRRSQDFSLDNLIKPIEQLLVN